MINRILKLVLALPLIVIMILMVVINVRLNYKPEMTTNDGNTINHDLLKELRGLKNALDHHADSSMQSVYPEGYVFLNAIYALAWSSFLQADRNNKFIDEGRAEIHKAWVRINSPTGRAPFSEELPLRYGSFYNGWSSYVLGSKLQLENAETRNKEEVDHFKQQCADIAKEIQKRTYPVSYYGSAWPADVMVCVASLSMHDKLFEQQYEDVIDQWLAEVRKRVDVNGMIPHSVHPADGSVVENARGSSQALILIFLRDIDGRLAKEQFKLFKEKFVATRFGLTGVREYPKGEFGLGDVDSGPVIFGSGGAATIVGMQTLSLYGEEDLSLRVRNGVEAFALPYQIEDQKKYFFGLVPIADAFIAWSHGSLVTSEKDISFMRFRIYSLLAFTLASIFFWIFVRNEPPDSKRMMSVSW